MFQTNTGAPGKRTLNNHGGLKKLVREASKPGARERAERELHELLHPTPEQKAARAQAETERRAETDQAEQLVQAIRELGGGTAAELAARTGWSKDTVQVRLRPLRKTGRVKSARVDSGDKRGTIDRYVLTDTPTSAPLENDPAAVAAATKPASRRAYAALVNLGAADSNAIAQAVGKNSGAVKWQLEELVNAGYLTKQPSGRKVGGGEVME